MSSQRVHGGLITLWLLSSCLTGAALGQDALQPNPLNPSELATPAPALRALPVEPDSSSTAPGSGPLPSETNPNNRFYTISVALRETYDTNINTTQSGGQSGPGTNLVANLLASHIFPEDNISGGYTFSVTYYELGRGNNGLNNNANGSSADNETIETSHDLNIRETHIFSDRLTLSLGEDGSYSVEPNIYQNAGTPFDNGEHLTNIFDANLVFQWTPLVGITTSYSNTLVRYADKEIADQQDSVQQNASATVSVSVLPKINATAGVILDDVQYDTDMRGYIDFTGFGGAQWQVNPNVSVSGRGGATLLHPGIGQDTISPYAALSLTWMTGSRTTLSADYSHEITPSSQVGEQAQTSDRVSASFAYSFSTRLSASFLASLTESTATDGLATNGQAPVSNNELVYYFSPGIAYHYNTYIDFDFGISLSANSSEVQERNYNRQEAYLGVRGTY